jgi:hypothetical protein
MKNFQINIRFFIEFILLIFLLGSINSFSFTPKDSSQVVDFNKALYTKAGDEILASVGNKKITVREFLSGYEFGPAFYKKEKQSKDLYLQYLIDEKLLALYGYSLGYADSVRVKELHSAIESDLATEQLFRKDILKDVNIPEKKIADAVRDKQVQFEIKWLYAPNEDSLNFFKAKLNSQISFDSLFNMQLKDSTYYDQRSMKIDKFQLSIKNNTLSKVVDTLKINEISSPVKTPDGWYILKISDIWKVEIVSESKYSKDEDDAKMALEQQEMDNLSDKYVRAMMLKNNPVIQARAFDFLRSYMGSYFLSGKLYKDWKLDERLQNEITVFDSLEKNNPVSQPGRYNNIILVSLADTSFKVSEFIDWFRLRDQYLKFDKSSFNAFSASLESLIWQMVRDNLLVRRANAGGFDKIPSVKEESSWWEDKIVYSIIRDQIANSIGLNIESPAVRTQIPDKKNDLINKTNKQLEVLRKKYKITINKKLLNAIKVKDDNNPHAIDAYIVKKGGIFPHPAYPSIDFNWRVWLENN